MNSIEEVITFLQSEFEGIDRRIRDDRFKRQQQAPYQAALAFLKAFKKEKKNATPGAAAPAAQAPKVPKPCTKCNGAGQMLNPRTGRVLMKEYRRFCDCPNGIAGARMYRDNMDAIEGDVPDEVIAPLLALKQEKAA